MIYVPATWWHEVEAHGDADGKAIGISLWFRPWCERGLAAPRQRRSALSSFLAPGRALATGTKWVALRHIIIITVRALVAVRTNDRSRYTTRRRAVVSPLAGTSGSLGRPLRRTGTTTRSAAEMPRAPASATRPRSSRSTSGGTAATRTCSPGRRAQSCRARTTPSSCVLWKTRGLRTTTATTTVRRRRRGNAAVAVEATVVSASRTRKRTGHRRFDGWARFS